jgi:hypothetical protein
MKQLQTKFLFFTLFLNMLFSSHLFAQEKGNAYYGNANYGNNRANQFSLQAPEFENDSTIVVGANILMNVKPSSYIIIIGLSQVGANTEICNQLLNQRIDGLTEKLVNLGINKNDIKKILYRKFLYMNMKQRKSYLARPTKKCLRVFT